MIYLIENHPTYRDKIASLIASLDEQNCEIITLEAIPKKPHA